MRMQFTWVQTLENQEEGGPEVVDDVKMATTTKKATTIQMYRTIKLLQSPSGAEKLSFPYPQRFRRR
jgi:hypothetical protein